MKHLDINGMFLALVVVMFLFLLQARANTIDIKMAFDFRDNEWKSIEFLAHPSKIHIFETSEDITDMVLVERVEERIVFYIKDKK